MHGWKTTGLSVNCLLLLLYSICGDFLNLFGYIAAEISVFHHDQSSRVMIWYLWMWMNVNEWFQIMIKQNKLFEQITSVLWEWSYYITIITVTLILDHDNCTLFYDITDIMMTEEK